MHLDAETAVPARRAIETAGLDAMREALVAACDSARAEDGSVRFDNVFKVVVARA